MVVVLALLTVLVAGRDPARAHDTSGAAPGSPRGAAAVLAVGSGHTCVRVPGVLGGRANVKCWGSSEGQVLGFDAPIGEWGGSWAGDQPGEMARVPYAELPPGDVAAVAAGAGQTCVLMAGGTLYCFGYASVQRQIGASQPAIDVGGPVASASVGDGHVCAVLVDGRLKCWGRNGTGQLGLGDKLDRGFVAGQMGMALPAVDLGRGRRAVQVSAGHRHTCALLDDGALKCWGYGEAGPLGLGDRTTRGDGPGEMGDALPAVDLGSGRTAVAVAAGRAHTCALLDTGQLKCWGYGQFGRLGQSRERAEGDRPGSMGEALAPIELGTNRSALSVVAGGGHTCALLDDHSVKCWGDNAAGQLGRGDTVSRGDDDFEMGDYLWAAIGPGQAVAVEAGDYTTCALLLDGSVRCWGAGNYLGYDSSEDVGDGSGEMPPPPVPLFWAVAPVAAAPAPPIGATASASDGSIAVAWSAPADDGGAPVSEYRVESSADGVAWSPAGSAAATSLSVPATAGSSLAFRVSAVNSVGVSMPSRPSNRVTVPPGPGGPGGPGDPGGPGAGVVVSVEPARLFDSRAGGATVDSVGLLGRRVAAGEVVEVPVAGRGGVAAGAVAAVVNVTAVGGEADGFATVFPCGALPNASNINYQQAEDIAAASVVRLSAAGSLCVYASATTDVLVDVTGYVPSGSPLVTLVPARFLDTRPGGSTIDGESEATARTAPGGRVRVKVADRGGVPAGVAAVIVNVTAVGPDAAGFATVFPCGDLAPNASTLNFQPGEDIANAAVIPVDGGGFVCVESSAGADYLIDVNGYVPTGSGLWSLVPARLLDTRSGGRTIDTADAGGGAAPAGGVRRVQVAGRGGVPTGARTVVVNVTAIGPVAAGYATVFPCGTPPNASNLNYRPGEDIPNAVITQLDADGGVCVYTDAAAHYVLDVTGYLIR